MQLSSAAALPFVLGLLAGVVVMSACSSWAERRAGQSSPGDPYYLPTTEWVRKKQPPGGVRNNQTTVDRHSPSPSSNDVDPEVPPTPIPIMKKPQPINFMHSPDTFVEIFQQCESDPRCHVIFHHVFKTGGTTIEKTLAALWSQPHNNSCCNEQRMRNFFQSRDYYCDSKFSSHQVNATDFFRAVNECVYRYPVERNVPQPRVVLLTTFREPIQMTLSQIHQMCNKNAFRREQYILDACAVCDYNNYTDVWDGMMQDVTDQLQAAWQVSQLQQSSSLTSTTNEVNLPADSYILTLENSDITDFFARFKPEHPLKAVNKERLNTCNFHPTSAMTKKLADAQRIYRQLVANKAYQ